MNDALITTVPCRRYRHGVTADIFDEIAGEIRIAVQMPDGACRRLFAAPIDPEVLALGHAALEMTGPGQVPEPASASALHFTFTLRRDQRPAPDPSLPAAVDSATLLDVMRRFIAASGLWDGTGCFHRAALYDTVSRTFVARAEDIGRHNCLDRLAGHAVRHNLCLPELVLLLSCRVTASMMEKILRAGLRVVVSRSAVTEAALQAARDAGVTLIGFARESEERFTVFTDTSGKVGP